MAFNKTNKKAQAAIEFLMTYGWMLLVVLIVGALIFSFVDFGNLLPSTVDFASSSIQGDPQATSAYGEDFGADSHQVYLAFSYTGGNRAIINSTMINVTDSISNTQCSVVEIRNDDTQSNSIATPAAVPFINGQKGTLQLDCSTIGGGTDLITGDSFEADINLGFEDSKRQGRVIPNKGTMRLPVQ
jgi:hypothetical protein